MEPIRRIIKKIDPTAMKLLAVLFVCLTFLIIVILFSNNYIILGGEGNYFTNFQLVRNYSSSTWAPLMNGTGSPNPIINMLVSIFDLFSFLQRSGISFKVINILSIFLVYMLPFLSMLWMLNGALRIRFPISFLISLFYIINPFSTYHLQGLMFWNSAPLFLLPLSFGIIYKYYTDKLKVFLFFGLVTSLFAFAFANIPYFGIFHIFLLLTIIIISSMREGAVKLKTIVQYFIITELSFFLFNFWWLANLLRFYVQDTGKYNLKGVSFAWAKSSLANGDGVMNNILSFRTLLGPGSDSFFSIFYYHALILLVLAIPLVIFVFLLFNTGRKRYKNKILLTVFIIFLFIIFLNKGAYPPFGNFYLWSIKYVPLFEIFKTPFEKFSVLFVFLFSLSLALVLKNEKNRIYGRILWLYILVCSIPFFTLNFMPDFKVEENVYISRKFINKKEYTDAEHFLNNDRINYRYLSLPGSRNYQVTMAIEGNKYYRGMDPVLYAIKKGFIGAYSGNFDVIYDNLSNKNLENILSLYNIKKIMVNEDIYPSFGFKELESKEQLNSIFSQKMDKTENGPIKIYSLNSFLPLFYTPQKTILSRRKLDDILRIVTQDDYNIRSGIFFEEQNSPESFQRISAMLEQKNGDKTPPSIEYKKISPVKYRIRIHKASATFPLIFSEIFHDKWKVYATNTQNQKNKIKSLDEYKILDGNEKDQATKDELSSYIKNRLVTTLGDGEEKNKEHDEWGEGKRTIDYVEKYKIKFISKNFNGTIQNDNLPDGKVWETWFEDPVGNDANHLMVNGYANGWLIDPGEICRENSLCSKNNDGTYDFELVVEFWPQRMLFIGTAVTLITTLISSGCLLYNWRSRKYGKNH